jgi:hypothetical protein
MYDEGHLNSISLGDEDEIISRPQGQKDTVKIAVGETVVRPVFVHDNPLAGQGLSNPLSNVSVSLCHIILALKVGSTSHCTLRSVLLCQCRFL